MYKFLYITRMPLLAVTDSKGQFVVKPKVHGQRVDIHTGGIDAAWSLAKKAIPSSVATKKKDASTRNWMTTFVPGNGAGKTPAATISVKRLQ